MAGARAALVAAILLGAGFDPHPAWAAAKEAGTAGDRAEDAVVTGSVELASKYVQRGMTDRADNEGLSIQPSLTVKLPWGFVFDYWGASCDYPAGELGPSYDAKGALQTVSLSNPRRAFENDLTLLWTLELGATTLKLGGQYMYYIHATENNAPEVYVEVESKPKLAGSELGEITLLVEYMLTNTPWTNPNDAYILLNHQYDLTDKWSTVWQLGAHLYGKSGNLQTKSTFSLRHVDVGLQRKFDNGLYLRGMFLFGGYDRLAQHLPNTQVWFLGYEF
ncbi:MAG: hypothetical protein HY902_07925 [Deltaproteobacteria bacterium]|nr:hypothetical protein [Deltaproteobacteria bacterium]